MNFNELHETRENAAHTAYEAYEFGDDVFIAGTGAWMTEADGKDTVMSIRCQLEIDVAGEGILNFAVRFPSKSSEPSDVRALLAGSGEEIGFMSTVKSPAESLTF